MKGGAGPGRKSRDVSLLYGRPPQWMVDRHGRKCRQLRAALDDTSRKSK